MIKIDIVIESLTLIQRGEHLTDKAMAQSLDYHQTTWVRLRRGEISTRNMRTNFLFHVIHAYPLLLPTVIKYLKLNAENRKGVDHA